VSDRSAAGPATRVVAADELRRFVTAVLEHAYVLRPDAEFVARVLVEADLRGVDSHGVTRLPGYLEMIERGLLRTQPDIRVVTDAGACALMDGDLGFGMLVARDGMAQAIDRAKRHGLGMVVARQAVHTGLVGYYTMTAADQGCIGIAMNNGPTIVPAFGGVTPIYATNPISAAFPAHHEEPVVLDMATSMVAAGKLRLAAKKGARIPTDWGTDANGKPTDDPVEVISNGFLQWAGGHKGYGLATVIELMTGVLSGGTFGFDSPALKHFGRDSLVQSATFIAIDIERFMPLEAYKSRVDRLVRDIHASKPAAGVKRVYAPGEPEFEHRRERMARGIPLSGAVFEELAVVGSRTGQRLSEPRPAGG